MALFSLLQELCGCLHSENEKIPALGVKSVEPVNILASKHYLFIIAMIADG